MMMNYPGNGVNSMMMGTMVLLVLLWVAVVGIGIWLVLRVTRRDSTVAKIESSPRATLDHRFAAGEITMEQYVEARKLLEVKTLL